MNDASFNPDLQAALQLEREAPGRFRADIPNGWQQGRGAFGGLVLGLLARAMETEVADEARPLRTLSGEIASPVLPGSATLSVEVVRRGSRLIDVLVRLTQEGEVRAHGSALFGGVRMSDRDRLEIHPPAPPPWAEVEVLPIGPPLGPPFARVFEFRNVGPFPMSGAPSLLTEGWVRLVTPPPVLGTPELVAFADSYWPTQLVVEEEPRPLATIAFTLQLFVAPASLDPAAPLYYRCRGLASQGGYAFELRELWTADGRLVALNPQTFAIIA